MMLIYLTNAKSLCQRIQETKVQWSLFHVLKHKISNVKIIWYPTHARLRTITHKRSHGLPPSPVPGRPSSKDGSLNHAPEANSSTEGGGLPAKGQCDFNRAKQWLFKGHVVAYHFRHPKGQVTSSSPNCSQHPKTTEHPVLKVLQNPFRDKEQCNFWMFICSPERQSEREWRKKNKN